MLRTVVIAELSESMGVLRWGERGFGAPIICRLPWPVVIFFNVDRSNVFGPAILCSLAVPLNSGNMIVAMNWHSMIP